MYELLFLLCMVKKKCIFFGYEDICVIFGYVLYIIDFCDFFECEWFQIVVEYGVVDFWFKC